jgi:aspartyl-tRNA(Asn)/glutamyl-tRNA(Gln) amidotransferase subunit A
LDHVGVLTRSAEDTALLLQVLAGYDHLDPECSEAPADDYLQALNVSLRGLRLGVPRQYFFEHVDSEVVQAASQALDDLERLRMRRLGVDLPDMRQVMGAMQLIMGAESAAFHDRWLRERPQDYGADVRARLEPGRLISATQYLKAQQARRIMVNEFLKLFEEIDVLATPTVPVLPEKIGESIVHMNGETEDVVSALGRLTRPTNLLSFPSISVPCAFSRSGLPIGAQLITKPFDEARLLQVAHRFSQHAEPHFIRHRNALAKQWS